jgi:hypothetical protein
MARQVDDSQGLIRRFLSAKEVEAKIRFPWPVVRDLWPASSIAGSIVRWQTEILCNAGIENLAGGKARLCGREIREFSALSTR